MSKNYFIFLIIFGIFSCGLQERPISPTNQNKLLIEKNKDIKDTADDSNKNQENIYKYDPLIGLEIDSKVDFEGQDVKKYVNKLISECGSVVVGEIELDRDRRLITIIVKENIIAKSNLHYRMPDLSSLEKKFPPPFGYKFSNKSKIYRAI